MPAREQSSLRPPSTLHHRCVRAVFWMLIAGLAVLAARLVFVQLWPDPFYLKSKTGRAPLVIPRGKIHDRDGQILARDKLVRSLWANPSAIDDPDPLARLICAAVDMDRREVLDLLRKQNSEGKRLQFVWVKPRLTEDEFTRLKELDVFEKGVVDFRWEYARFYPEHELAAHILGFVNMEGVGAEGIEAKYNEMLISKPGMRRAGVPRGRQLMWSRTVEHRLPKGGDDLWLTICKPLQYLLERELEKAMKEHKAPRAMGLLMDPKNGAILAMASLPAFDPNTYNECPAELRKNRAIVDVFEPGSSFKIIPAAAALEEGLLSPNTMIDCSKKVRIGRHTIGDFHQIGRVSFAEAFAQSSNIAIIKVANWLGEERFPEWIDAFGFGKQVCRDFQTESSGLRGRWSGYSMFALPIGQEIAVTMPQLARAYAVLANGGFLVEPHVVERVVGRKGELVYQYQPGPPRRILSARTAQQMRALCSLVVNHEHGTGRRARIEDFEAAGKTGTAQIAKPEGGFYEDKYTAVFAGFAPVSDPQVCAVIVVQEPDIELHYGGYVCGPVFARVVREALIQLNCQEYKQVEPAQDEDRVRVARGAQRGVDRLTSALAGLRRPEDAGAAVPGDVVQMAAPEPAVEPVAPVPDERKELEEDIPLEIDRPVERTIAAAQAMPAEPAESAEPALAEVPGHPAPEKESKDASPSPSELPGTAPVPEAAPLGDADVVVASLETELLEPSEEEIWEDIGALEPAKQNVDPAYTGPRLPDFRGKTKHQVREELVRLGLSWDAQGSGWVESQQPAPGTPLSEVSVCRLKFSNKGREKNDA